MQRQRTAGDVVSRTNVAYRRTGWFRRLCADVFLVAKREKKWWLLPLILLLLIIAGMLAFVTLAGPLAPFIYPLL